jgi:hypothetical protein
VNGEVDPLYQEARRVLLDVIEKLDGLRRSVVLVGAQAVHLRVADVPAQLVAYTTDGDIAVDPMTVAPEPDLAAVMEAAGMRKGEQPGIWSPKAGGPDAPTVDLLVPMAFAASPGKRGAVLRGHTATMARYVRGIEGCLVDSGEMTIGALDMNDARRFRLRVAGAGALLIAKLHKLGDRIRDERRRDRLEPKDAYEAYRLMQLPTDAVVAGWKTCLADERARAVASEAIPLLKSFFGMPGAPGSKLAAEYADRAEDPEVLTASAAALANEVLTSLS